MSKPLPLRWEVRDIFRENILEFTEYVTKRRIRRRRGDISDCILVGYNYKKGFASLPNCPFSLYQCNTIYLQSSVAQPHLTLILHLLPRCGPSFLRPHVVQVILLVHVHIAHVAMLCQLTLQRKAICTSKKRAQYGDQYQLHSRYDFFLSAA